MPVTKRILFHSTSFQTTEQIVEVDSVPTVQVYSYAQILGTIHQISYLSSYALEIFQNLAILAEDVHERTKLLARRTQTTLGKLGEYDKGVRHEIVQPDLKFNRLSVKYLRYRELSTPPIFVKTTNYSSVLIQYKICRTNPQLWRIENVIGEDCFQYFSYPGYFFEEWLKTEIIKQELKKDQRKKEKALKKQQKKERKQRQREELGFSFKPAQRDSQGAEGEADYRPRSLLAREVKEGYLPRGLRSSEGGDPSPSPPHSELAAANAPVTASSNSTAPPVKKSGLSAVFGFLSKEKSGPVKTSETNQREPDDDPPDPDYHRSSSNEMKSTGNSNIPFSSSTQSNERRRAHQPMDSLSQQILRSKFKSSEGESSDPRYSSDLPPHHHSNRIGSSNLSGAGLFEQIPAHQTTSETSFTKPSISEIERSYEHPHHRSDLTRREREAERDRGSMDDEEEDPFSLTAATMNRPQINYQTTTKLGKYLSSKRSQEKEMTTTSSSLSPRLSTASPATLLLSKKVGGGNSGSSPITISLLPTATTTSTTSPPHIEALTVNETMKTVSGAGRKRNSVIFNPNLLSSLREEAKGEEKAISTTALMDSLRADILGTAIKEEEEEEEEEEDDRPRDEEEEEVMVSSRPFSAFKDVGEEDEEDFPVEESLPFDEEEEVGEEEEEIGSSSQRRGGGSETSATLSSHRRGPPPPPPPPPSAHNRPPPPPPAPPKVEKVKAAVGDDVLANIRAGSTSLRRVEIKREERVVDMRTKLLSQIKDGGSRLRTVQVSHQSKKINTAMQNAAVAAILANRSKIAGSDSESDSDDDSVFTDDDYG